MAAEYLWSQIEPGTAILCACLTTYRPLITSLLSTLLRKSGSTSSFSTPIRTPRDSQIEAERNFYLQHLAERSPRKVNRFWDMGAGEFSAELMDEGAWSPRFGREGKGVEVLGAPPGMSPYLMGGGE